VYPVKPDSTPPGSGRGAAVLARGRAVRMRRVVKARAATMNSLFSKLRVDIAEPPD